MARSLKTSLLFIAAFILPLIFLMCSSREKGEDDNGALREMTFRVSAGEFDITKATLEDGREEIHWSSSDKISVFAGDANYFFSLSSTEEDGYVGLFKGEAPHKEHYYVLYPGGTPSSSEEGILKACVPTGQKAVKGGVDPKALVMSGVSSGDEIELQSAVAILGFSTDNDDVSSVRISLMKGQPGGLTGDILIEPSSNELSVEYDEGLSYVEVSGNFEAKKTYYAAVAPGDYSGFTVTVSRGDGEPGVFDFERAVSVAPGEGLVLGTFTVEIPEEGGEEGDEGDEGDEGGEDQYGVRAVPANDFLASIGVNTAIASRGEWIEKTEENLRYTGIRWVRSSYSGEQREIDNFRRLHNNLGTKFSLMPPTINDNLNIEVCLEGGRKLAEMGALLAFEGPNEPNNWAITYKNKKGGGSGTWKPLAEFMRDFYAAVKSDPVLKDYPVWSASEMGAETDNVGLQYLIIPPGAGCLMPDGTAYATHACCHNYFIHPKWPGIHDNQTWCAADPIEQKYVDGLYDNHGVTWSKKYPGYSAEERETLPRVTTETGVTLDCTYTNWDGSTGSQNMGITEHMQGVMYVNCYLAQFVRGWANTAIYILRDRGDELSNQTFGMYGCGPWDYGKGGWSYTKRVSADYMHNFTTILEDSVSISDPGCLDYTIPNMPATSHELLLQKNDGTFFLVLWGERYKGGTDNVVVKLSSKWAAVRAYDVVAGTGVSKTYTNTDSVSVSLTDHPVILEFVK